MIEQITADQVRTWLDPQVVSDVQEISEEETVYNLQIAVSQLPLHVVKEVRGGPLRIVGKNEFDTPPVAALLADEETREELLRRIGPALASVPGFYTFMDEEGSRCEFANARVIQLEHRLYPDGVSQHRLMSTVIAVAKGMRFIQNVVTIMREDAPPREGE